MAAGRIGLAVLRRLKPFDVQAPLHRQASSAGRGREGAGPDLPSRRRVAGRVCDVVTINGPLHPETENLFNDALLGKMKRGSYIVNTARGQDLRPRRRRPGARERTAGRLRGRRLVPPAAAEGPPLADDAPPRHDPARLGNVAFRPGPLRRRHAGDSRVLVCRAADPRRIPDRRRRASWPGRARIPTAPGEPPAEPARRPCGPSLLPVYGRGHLSPPGCRSWTTAGARRSVTAHRSVRSTCSRYGASTWSTSRRSGRSAG